jgi:hypothetical protein
MSGGGQTCLPAIKHKCRALSRRSPGPLEIARLTLVDLGEHGVEAPKAAETGAEGNFGERQVRRIDHALGPLHTGRFGDLGRTCSKMLLEQSAQMARANPEMLHQRFDPALIEGTLID